ncbi:hypothetical protein THAOC_24671 [Thalassiosira oceanica]|uniref:Uncharacterized protein n=1 Tax=Thalassiosira oceanica TaxID=159749 RepID=K0SA01_THAOC|nr:hypothetical protein THAOC_24671 [Thalassiosira oceanica]|eukprot:EJK55587.1 hypothetical protein THAOC_24671 [Thalassiosira oceanica]
MFEPQATGCFVCGAPRGARPGSGGKQNNHVAFMPSDTIHRKSSKQKHDDIDVALQGQRGVLLFVDHDPGHQSESAVLSNMRSVRGGFNDRKLCTEQFIGESRIRDRWQADDDLDAAKFVFGGSASSVSGRKAHSGSKARPGRPGMRVGFEVLSQTTKGPRLLTLALAATANAASLMAFTLGRGRACWGNSPGQLRVRDSAEGICTGAAAARTLGIDGRRVQCPSAGAFARRRRETAAAIAKSCHLEQNGGH